MSWRDVTFAAWALLAAAVVVLAVLSVAPRSPVAGPLAPLRAYLASHRVARAVVVVAWMWAGWHLFAR